MHVPHIHNITQNKTLLCHNSVKFKIGFKHLELLIALIYSIDGLAMMLTELIHDKCYKTLELQLGFNKQLAFFLLDNF